MNNNDLKLLAEGLIEKFEFAEKSHSTFKEGLNIQIKRTVASNNGDLQIDKLICDKIC